MSTTPSVGHHEIDSQHDELDHLVDKTLAFCGKADHSAAICAACSPEQQASCRREVMALTRELLKFMAGHFRYEEQLMRSLPDNDVCRAHVKRHHRAHAEISACISALTAQLATADPYAVASELRRIMMEWTGPHASGLDSGMVKLQQRSGHGELDEDAELVKLLAQARVTLNENHADLHDDKEKRMITDNLLDHARIFIIDDEAANLKLLDKMLASQGYQERVLIQDPREVLARYQGERPDLILLDINMPHLDGYQVMEQIKALDDPMMPPIVVLTAQHGRDNMLKALSAGARDFIGKPFDRAELLMRVRNLLDAQLGHRMLHQQKDVLEEMVRLRTEELNRTRLQVVQRLGRAAEYRDNETGYHILRMSQMSALLARKLGWSAAEAELMLHASPMHDIGKIGIPDHILLKPGKFEPAEWEIMKTHATIGAELLDGDASTLLRLAREIALSHHEKWDSSGYPNGLAGETIPQSGRIVAVADVFDALTSSRPYKQAWTVEAAEAYVRDNAGSHFDPAVVACFLECLPEIIKIRDLHQESDGCSVDLKGESQ
jgi:putative two-component system response regulator